jgi:hypothetical protein
LVIADRFRRRLHDYRPRLTQLRANINEMIKLKRLWVPITYATKAIFMNHASGAVAPKDAETVQVCDAIW